MKESSSLWIHRLEGAIDQLREVPLWGNLPPFPWEGVFTRLQQTLQLPSLEIISQQSRLVETEDLVSAESTVIPVHIFSMPEQAYVTLLNVEVEKLIRLSLSSEREIQGFLNEGLRDGYARFLFLKILHAINQENAFPGLSVQMGATVDLPHKESLCLDLSFQIGEETLSLRLICPDAFVRGLKSYYASMPSFFLSRFGASIPLSLSITIGTTSVLPSQWETRKTGDLVLLDRCSFDPIQKRGRAILALENTPLFTLELEDSIKIVEHAFYQEEMPMARHPSHQDQPSSSEEEKGHLWSAEEESPVGNILSAQEIPLMVTVEIARLTLPLKKIVELQSGNVLDLQVSPHLTVSLTINGQQVAKGELVKIGESVGVKILAL